MKELTKRAIAILVLMMIFINSSLLLIISEAIEEIEKIDEQSEIEPYYEMNLEKYVNYDIQSSAGTLVQINAKTGIEYTPMDSIEILLNIPKIEGEYPENIEIVEKNAKSFEHTYDNQTGELKVFQTNLNNLADTEESKVETKQENEYAIILNYSANCYNNENIERELEFSGFVQAVLDDEEKTIKKTDIKQDYTVSENISGLVSTNIKTTDIYNGYIQSNIENETEYKTDYTENLLIDVSKKDIANEIIVNAKNELINNNDEKFETNEIIYKSTKIEQSELLSKLGEEGYIQILDEQGQIIGEINKDNYEVTYNNEISKITMKTSNPLNVGTILLQNTKQIKETMKDTQNNRINVNNAIQCIVDEKETYQFENNNETEIKNAETKVGLAIDKMDWTNNIQNDVNITATLMANNIKYKLFKNPILEIRLPEEVEKVILKEVSLLYDNGLNIKNKEVVEQDNYKVIRIELEGKQNEYFTNSIIEGTSISIPATIIVKKDVETADKNISLTYTNEGEESKNQELNIHIESNVVEQPEITQVDEMETVTEAQKVENKEQGAIQEEERIETQTPEEKQIEGLDVKVEAILGDKVLEDGATIHEKQIIKYKVTATNNSNNKIEGIKVECDVPEGTTYATVDIGTYIIENYEYVKNNDIKQNTMVIKEIEPGKSRTGFYEVVVDELADGETQKDITTTFTTKVNDKTYNTQTINNVIEKAQLEVYIRSYIGREGRNSFYYYLDIKNLTDHEINNVQIQTNPLQKELVLKEATFYDSHSVEKVGSIDENNQYVATIDTIAAQDTRSINLIMTASNFDDDINECPLTMVMTVKTDDTQTYISNENRRTSYPEYVTATQSLNKEGENVSVGDTVEYKYVIKNESKVRTVVEVMDKYSEYLEDVKAKFNMYNIIVPEGSYRLPSDTQYDLEEEQNVEYELIEEEINVSDLEEFNEFTSTMVIPAGKALEITVTGTAGKVVSTTEVANYMVVSGPQIKTKSTNISKFNILAPENPDDKEPIFPDEPNEPEDPDNPSTVYNSVNGMVWIDANKDGIKQSDEETLEGVTVKLYNANTNSIVVDKNNNKQITTTKKNGMYNFINVSKGNYLVLFEYDVNNYDITKFTKYGQSTNTSNAMKKTVDIDGKEIVAGVTDIIKVDSFDIENVNMGLVEKGNFDLKLDKYISQITVKNDTTKTYEYNNSKLAKIEIDAKKMEKTQVEIKYKIVITNEGNVTAYADEIIDYIPEEMQVSTNNNWKENQDRNLVNTSLVGEGIKPGQSKELELVVTKQMNLQNTGTVINAAEIGSSQSTEGAQDVDSLAGNRNPSEDDYSEATVIISIKTGLVRNIIIVIAGLGLICLIIIFVKKVKNKKMFIFITTLILFTGMTNIINAYDVEIHGEHTPFVGTPLGEQNQAVGPPEQIYSCMQPGRSQCSTGQHYYVEDTSARRSTTISSTTIIHRATSVKSTTEGTHNVEKSEKSQKEDFYEDYIFEVEGGNFDSYSVIVTYIPDGKKAEIYRTSENVKVETRQNDAKTKGRFNITVPKKAHSIKVSIEVKVENATEKVTTRTVTREYVCRAIGGNHTSYHCADDPNGSHVQRMTRTKVEEEREPKNKILRKSFKTEEVKYGNLRVIKVDEQKKNLIKKSGGATTEFRIICYDWNTGKDYYVKCDEDGRGSLVDRNGDNKNAKGVLMEIGTAGYKTIKNLPIDDNIEYYFKESKAKQGYVKLDYEYELNVEDENATSQTRAKNAVKYLLTRSSVKKRLNELCANNNRVSFTKKYIRHIYNISTNRFYEGFNQDIGTAKMEALLKEIGGVFEEDTPSNDEIKTLVNYIFEKYVDKNTADNIIANNINGVVDLEYSGQIFINGLRDELKINFTELETITASSYCANRNPNLVPNERAKGWIKIEKRDKDTKEMLEGATFRIYGTSEEGKKVSIITTTNKNGIALEEIDYGTYTVEEIETPPGYIYEYQERYETFLGEDNHIRKSDIKVEEVNTKSKPKIVDFENKYYIDISGYVWEDLEYQNSGKTWTSNDLYKQGSLDVNDKRVQGIKVCLKYQDPKTKEIKAERYDVTDENGEYKFQKVEIAKLSGYYVEFEYNGMEYESVVVDTNMDNGSKSSEGTYREQFNKKYETIVYGQAKGTQNGKETTQTLTYEMGANGQQGVSKLVYGNSNEFKYGYDGNTAPVSGVYEQYRIISNTLNGYGGGLNNAKIKTNQGIDILIDDKTQTAQIMKENGILEIKNINLGIQKRKKIDLGVNKEIYQAKININGQTQIFNYTDRNNIENQTNRCNMDPQVKFGEKAGRFSYTRAVYASDIAYTGDNKLSIYVTYKIRIENSSSQLTTYIDELVDYYDSKYLGIRHVGIGEKDNGNNNQIIYREEFNVIDQGILSENSEYKKAIIQPKGGQKELLKAGKDSVAQFYMELEVDPTQLFELLSDRNDQEIVKLDNLIEINSYSTKDGNAIYAAIDTDSQPGNLDLSKQKTQINSAYDGNIQTYEDDTDKAPGLKIVLQEERKVSGMVFEDASEGEVGKIRQGDGEYKGSPDKGIAGIEVRLVLAEDSELGKAGETAKHYEYDYKTKTFSESEIRAITKADGTYELEGCIPDKYYVEYIWGDKTYKVQDYKSTIVDENEYRRKLQNLTWYKDSTLNGDARKSDAVDDYNIRQQIDEQSQFMINANKTAIQNYQEGVQIKLSDGTTQTLITKMKSQTPIFRMDYEYIAMDVDEYEKNEDGTIKMNGKYVVKKEEYKNNAKNVDFGIVERARQVLELEKQVSEMKVTLENGVTLINAQIDSETGKLKDNVKNVAYVPESSVNAQIKVEMDSQIIQGSTLEVEYQLQVKNSSELDYANEDYYKYGSSSGNTTNAVKLSPDKVIDYLDNGITIDKTQQTILEKDDLKTLRTKGFFSGSREMEIWIESTNKSCITENLKGALLPGEKAKGEFKLNENKLLSNEAMQNGIELENHAEIIQITQTGGRPIKTIPGSYIPTDLSTSEEDDARAEGITIITATGLSVDYIAYTLLAISSLGILTAGIILIKKYVA